MTRHHSIIYLTRFLITTISLVMAPAAFALVPVLHFSDINSGPKTGLNDGLGSGEIVTIWSNNLGDLQDDSKVYIGHQKAAHVYSWAPNGANNIHAAVNGTLSNTLPFTIRDGNIFFVAQNGRNTNGSWVNPWETLNDAGSSAGGKFNAGDIAYVTDGLTQNSNGGLRIMRLKGTAENPYTITETSPANNAGVISTLPIPYDLAGVPRRGAEEIFIGAYEYSGAAKAPPSATQLMIIDE